MWEIGIRNLHKSCNSKLMLIMITKNNRLIFIFLLIRYFQIRIFKDSKKNWWSMIGTSTGIENN